MRIPLVSRWLERRTAGTLTDPYVAAMLGSIRTSSGASVSPKAAEGLSTVLACVSAISTALASLDVFAYRRDTNARTEIPDHPLMRMVRGRVNAWQHWPDAIEWLMAQTLLHGNGLMEIVTDDRGVVTALLPIPWGNVSVVELPTGRLAYDIALTTGRGALARPRRLLADEVLHLRDRSDDGMVGRSRLSRAAETVGTGMSLQQAVGSLWRNGVNPSGVLSLKGNVAQEAIKRVREQLAQIHTGTAATGTALVVTGETSWSQLTISPEDAEILASRRFTTEELARIFQVPPPLVGIWDHSSFTNSETAGRWFSQFTLSPWTRKLALAIGEAMFSEGERQTHEIDFDMSTFLRGDPEARWKGHAIAVKHRILTPNEIRQSEGWNPRAGGDAFDAPVAGGGNA